MIDGTGVTLASGTDLLTALRQATQAQHRELEHTALMQQLIAGRLPRGTFCALQRNLHALYAALEAGLQRHARLIERLCPGWPAPADLARTERLAADLHHLHGPDWAGDLALTPAMRADVDRLGTLDQSAPGELLAHAYVRYLGDLAGGQMLARRVQSAYGMSGAAGIAFFAFGSPQATAALTQTLRSALQGCQPEAGGADAQIAEAQWAFAQHAHAWAELSAPTRGRS